jgi:uncharacterized protein (DUF1697 family)
MSRYLAFLRGVSPVNAKMPDLRRCFESAGFSDVRTVLSSGNVAFSANGPPDTLADLAEQAMRAGLGRSFPTIVRTVAHLRGLLESDPFAGFDLPPGAKRVVTFLRHPVDPGLSLPVERDSARILTVTTSEAFTAYVPNPKGPVFMTLLERTLGADITTRTLDTVQKCARV